MPLNIFRPSNSNSKSVGESRIFSFNLLRHSTRVHPLDKEKVRSLFPNMSNLPTFDCIGLKDFDLSFILDYENQVLSVQSTQNRHCEPELGILQIFNESKQTRSLRKIARFIDMLMQKYGLIFVNAVVDSLLGSIEMPKFPVTSATQNKIVVFIDDPHFGPNKVSWMGRMLTVGLLSYGIIPLLIPWNDLINSNQAILHQLSLLSPHATNPWKLKKDFRWVLQKGFSLALRCAHKNVIIVDVDWKLVKIHEFIAEAEVFGYELLFMKNHAEINRANFVRTVTEKIKKLLSEKFFMEIDDPCISPNVVVEEVRHQNYSKKSPSKKLNAQEKAKLVKASTDKITPADGYGDVFEESNIVNPAKETNNSAEITGNFEPPLNSKCKSSTPGFLSRMFSNTQVKAKPKFPLDGLKPRNKKFIFTLPKLFGSAESPSVNEPDQCQQQIYNPNILPRLTDDQFDRLLVRPKIYARETKIQEDKLFSHTRRDLDDLDSIFTNSVKSD